MGIRQERQIPGAAGARRVSGEVAASSGPEAERAADAELARRIVAGDGSAFDLFYEENVGRVYAVVLRMCGDEVRARRLTQDTFVRAWERMATYRAESRLSSWLHRVATNVALESGRRRSRWWGRLASEPARLEDRPGATGDPGLRMDLERAIAGLPPGAREMLVLRDVEGHSYREIADMTGAAMGTVKAQIHRARRLMREALDL
jgi:RNA polymerase sigma-70 factor (ECF subfamily)